MTTSLTRWTPTGDLFRTRFSRLFDQAFNDMIGNLEGNEETARHNWVPPVDIRESEDSLLLTAELPGLSKDDIEITVEDHVLSLRGQRKLEKDVQKESYHRMERAYGTFSRTFSLPTNVRTDQVNASFKDGLLHVEIPKAEEAKPRKIAIR